LIIATDTWLVVPTACALADWDVLDWVWPVAAPVVPVTPPRSLGGFSPDGAPAPAWNCPPPALAELDVLALRAELVLVEVVPVSMAVAARSDWVSFMAVMLEICEESMLLWIWLTTASTSCEAAILLEAKLSNVSQSGSKVLACVELIAREVFSSLKVPTSNCPSNDSVLEALVVTVALCVLPQALNVRIRLITIDTKTNFFILISFRDVKTFSLDNFFCLDLLQDIKWMFGFC
jgi:hypothetical protein